MSYKSEAVGIFSQRRLRFESDVLYRRHLNLMSCKSEVEIWMPLRRLRVESDVL